MSEAANVVGAAELLRVVGSLVLVAALVVFSGFVARRRMNRAGERTLRVDERLTLARGVQLALVAHEDRRLLVGVCDKGVQLVADLGEAETETETATSTNEIREASTSQAAARLARPHRDPAKVPFAERLAERLVAHLPGAGRQA